MNIGIYNHSITFISTNALSWLLQRTGGWKRVQEQANKKNTPAPITLARIRHISVAAVQRLFCFKLIKCLWTLHIYSTFRSEAKITGLQDNRTSLPNQTYLCQFEDKFRPLFAAYSKSVIPYSILRLSKFLLLLFQDTSPDTLVAYRPCFMSLQRSAHLSMGYLPALIASCPLIYFFFAQCCLSFLCKI